MARVLVFLSVTKNVESKGLLLKSFLVLLYVIKFLKEALLVAG